MDTFSTKTLAEYVLMKHGDAIKSSLIQYFRDNNLYATAEKYDDPVKNVFSIKIYFEDYRQAYFKIPGDLVDFDIKVDCLIEVTNMVGNELEVRLFNDTYTLRIKAELNKGLHNLLVDEVKYGSHMREFSYDNSLSEFLTPYIRSYDNEKYAHEFLETYYPEALTKPTFVNPVILLDRMGLSIFFARLGDGVDGEIIFADKYADVLDVKSGSFKRVIAKEGTILINVKIIEKGRGCLNNTIVHECLHWWLHKKYFELQMLLSPNNPSSKSYIDEMEMPDKKKFINKYYMELQARSISPIVLMPRETASSYYETILTQLENRKSYQSKNRTFLYALYKFAEKFGASTSSARIRLENLGYTEVSFSSKMGNDLKIRPFKSSVRLGLGQTYILEFSEAVKAFSKDQATRLALASGKILYVDGLFVINDEKYVKFYKYAKPRLTELALSDVSKCCILFETKKAGVSVEFNPVTFNFVTFCSDGSKTQYAINPSVSKGERNKEIIDLKRTSLHQKDEIEEARDFVSKMNRFDTFSSKLDCLLGEECMGFKSDRGIGSMCKIDGKTITAYRKGISKPDEKKLLAICAGLQLHPLVSGHLFKANRMDIYAVSEEPYPFYFHLMTTCYKTNIDTWNSLIKEAYPEHQEYIL